MVAGPDFYFIFLYGRPVPYSFSGGGGALGELSNPHFAGYRKHFLRGELQAVMLVVEPHIGFYLGEEKLTGLGFRNFCSP